MLAGGAATAQAHLPILFVHGWKGSESNWTTMIGRFEKDGWPKEDLNNWTYHGEPQIGPGVV
jgi:triacylglycerol lipase